MGHRRKSRRTKYFKNTVKVEPAQSKANTDQVVEQLPVMEQLLAKINNLKFWQVAIVIIAVGIATHFTGLNNPFMGDDNDQIVHNSVVHSISNFPLFFEGSTFYNGQGLVPLSGTYYRPLMATVFSIIYTLFGANPFYFHAVQLALVIAGAVLLFLILKRIFDSKLLALVLALVFIVHPANSQDVYAIPTMQDALLFLFGLMALWLLQRFHSVKSLVFVALSLFLAMLSKEMGLAFVALSLAYILWFDRKRLLPFVGIMLLPIVLYAVLKVHAVGLNGRAAVGPIDNLNLSERLFTLPSIVYFFLSKFVLPWKLASAYHWVYPAYSLSHVLLPLLVDLAIVAVAVYVGFLVRRRVPERLFHAYLFFAVWTIIGIVPYLQIIPLDMTVCESWLYFAMAGMLGTLGVVFIAFQERIRPGWFLIACILVIGVLGVRTVLRGYDWSDPYVLATEDIASSPQDYNAYDELSENVIDSGNYDEAKAYAEQSIKIYPTFNNYNDLGRSLTGLGDYAGALRAYNTAQKYGATFYIADSIGELTLVYGDPVLDKQYLLGALKQYPEHPSLWIDLAILDEQHHDNSDAKDAILNAAAYGDVLQSISDGIMNNQPFMFEMSTGQLVKVP
jgi:hypothetical protein